MDKKALQMSFQWLFALIVGAFILFLAIYGTIKTLESGDLETSAKASKELEVLLNPLETGFESSSSIPLQTPVETRIFNNCYNYGAFGEQGIQTSQKSFNTWPEPILENTFQNKYIFSEDPVQGRLFYLFSKPFEFPFKVADLIYITSSNNVFCFVNAPSEIEEELTDLKQPNLILDSCPENSIEVCFDSSNCDINVDYSGGSVEKNNYRVYFETDVLMYGAIFSDADVYECQTKRLIKRLQSLASLYKDKSDFIAQKGCSSDMSTELINLYNSTSTFEDSFSLHNLNQLAQDLEDKNDYADCKLY